MRHVHGADPFEAEVHDEMLALSGASSFRDLLRQPDAFDGLEKRAQRNVRARWGHARWLIYRNEISAGAARSARRRANGNADARAGHTDIESAFRAVTGMRAARRLEERARSAVISPPQD